MSYIPDWVARTFTIPKTDLTLVSASPEVYDLDMDLFHKEVRRLEWEFDEGLWAPQILQHIEGSTFSGVTTSDTLIVYNGYVPIFEAGNYAVNLVGANNNVADIAAVNGVSIRPQNSTGKQKVAAVESSGDIASAVWDEVL